MTAMHEHHHHHHHHSHGHSDLNNQMTLNKLFIFAVVLNLIFTMIEFLYAYFSRSSSLAADAGHNLMDVLGLAFSGVANWLLSRASSQKFSYGLKRTTILASVANAILLIVASVFIILDAFEKIIQPVIIQEKIVIVVATIGILINGGSALLFLRDRHHDLNVKSAYLHLLYDALLSVGVVITGILVYFTHWYWLDPLVGIALVITIVVGTWRLLRDSTDLLLDAVPTKIDQQRVREYLTNVPGVTSVHDLHIWALSTQHVALTAHLVMPQRYLTDQDYLHINHDLLEQFQIDHVTLQVERGPDTNPCGQANGCS